MTVKLLPLLSLAALIAASPASRADSTSEISTRAKHYVDTGEVPGIIVGIWKRGESPQFIQYGFSDIANSTPMIVAAHQRIGSITKSYTITRLLQLADDGRLSIDDPIEKYVPGLKNGQATLRQLANMTSGIFNYTEAPNFGRIFATNLTKKWTDDELISVANANEPYFAPGQGWHYSNTNTVLLGMVVERVTGRSLRTELTRGLIRPLGITETLYPTADLPPLPYIHAYGTLDPDQGLIDVSKVSPTGFSGAGAMISTIDDTHRWGRILARGTLLSRRTQLARLQMVNSAEGIGPYYDRYGLGMGRIDGWIGHTAETFGTQSLMMHNLVADATVVIFVNASNPAKHIPTVLFQSITRFLPSAIPGAPSVAVTGKHQRSTAEPVVRIRGRASSAAGVLLVQYTVNGGFPRFARGTTIWRAPVTLQKGRNVLAIRSIDRQGRKSRPTRVIVTQL